MKILFDHQAFDLQCFGGVSNSFAQLIANMPREVEPTIALLENDNVHLNENFPNVYPPKSLCASNFIINSRFKGQIKLYKMYSKYFPSLTSMGRNRLHSIELLKKGNYDVFHPTFFDDYFLQYLNDKPFVLTIHDMISEIYYSPKSKQAVNKKLLSRLASHIVAVSEKTKNDIIDILGVPESKITVIYHGAPDKGSRSREPLIKKRYILYVGSRDSYKCFIPMMTNLLPVLDRHKDIHIVCSGPDFTRNEISFFRKMNILDRMLHVRGDDELMMNLYTNAICFIFPSCYEGFGMPILEAYKAGCPVLLNNKSCFPEIAQDAAVYFDLNEETSDLSTVLESFLDLDDTSKNILLEKQQKRLEFFSWKESARKLSEVYRSVI